MNKLLRLAFVIFATVLSNQLLSEEIEVKRQHVKNALLIVNQITNFALRSVKVSPGERLEKDKTRELLSNITSPKELYQIALICNTLYYPGDASDIRIDVWFSNAYWVSVNKLVEIGTEESLEALEAISKRSAFDGGDSLLLKESIKRLREHLKPAR